MRFQATAAGNNPTNTVTALDSAAQFAKQKTTTTDQANMAAKPSDQVAGLTKPRDQQQPVGLAKGKTSSSQDQAKAVKQASSQVKTKTPAASKTGN